MFSRRGFTHQHERPAAWPLHRDRLVYQRASHTWLLLHSDAYLW